MKNILGIIISIIYIGIILLTSKLFEKNNKEFSRKYIHIMLCNWWVIAMIFFDSWKYAFILPLLFVIINTISYKYNLIKSMEREENEGFGTIYYAISLLILSIVTFILNKPILGLAGVFVMGYGDGLAAVIGQKVKGLNYKVFGTEKTLAGSITMLVISFIITTSILYFMGVNLFIIKAIIISVLATLIEAISVKGLDNITVPLLVSAMVYLFM